MNALRAAQCAVAALKQRERATGEERLTLAIEALGYFALAANDLQPPATEQAIVPMPRLATGGYVPTSERTSEIPAALSWCPNGDTRFPSAAPEGS